jgi:glucose/mannose-6-phosphate isomerase
MENLIKNFPNQLKKAFEIARTQQNITKPLHNIQNVVVAGLGGSGIGGSIIENLILNECIVPIKITKSYTAPAFIDKNTLFVASSFSGSTEETLMTLEQVKDAKIACISSGGKLIEMAKAHHWDYVQIPNEAPCPRAFVGYSLVQLAFLLKNYGLISEKALLDLEKGINIIDSQQEQIREDAKEIAKKFYKKLPILYADDKFEPILIRLQQQINENAKQLCHWAVFPEMNHNELVGWQLDKENYKGTAVMMLHTSSDHARVKVRMQICEEVFAKKADEVFKVLAKGDSLGEQYIYLIHLFDWISFYLAELNHVDPFPVDIIFHLKSELAKI